MIKGLMEICQQCQHYVSTGISMCAIQNLYVCTYIFKAQFSHVSQSKNGPGFAELCNMDQSLLNPKLALLNITGNPTLVVPNINVKPNASQTINCDVYGAGGQVRTQRVSMKCRAACVTRSTLRLKRSLHCRKVQE